MVVSLGCDVKLFALSPSSFLSLVIGQTEADVKEPTLLFKKSFPGVVACLILHTLYITGQVCYRKLINGLDGGCWCPLVF